MHVSLVDRIPLLAGMNHAKGQMLYRLGLRRHKSGATAYTADSVASAVQYIRSVVQDYIQSGAGGDVSRIVGKRILEIGPGDNLGVALTLVGLGAESVTCIDGFKPQCSPERNEAVYAEVLNTMTSVQRDRAEWGRIRAHYDCPIERGIGSAEFDIIISRAVLEHVKDLPTAWRRMTQGLRRDGEMWHEVDFRCHNILGEVHPLYFLTVPQLVWKLISSPDPTLNRARPSAYRKLAEESFAESAVTTVSRHKCSVATIRKSLLPQFRECSDDELLIASAFVNARHPLA